MRTQDSRALAVVAHNRMKRLLVSLDITSASLTLEELVATFGVSQSENSFSRGDIDDLGRTRRYSLLRFESSAADAATCDEHIATLQAGINRIDDHLEIVASVDINLLLNIAILFTTADGSVDFTAIRLRNRTVPLRLSVTAYPLAGSQE
jgi:hypothetical protein